MYTLNQFLDEFATPTSIDAFEVGKVDPELIGRIVVSGTVTRYLQATQADAAKIIICLQHPWHCDKLDIPLVCEHVSVDVFSLCWQNPKPGQEIEIETRLLDDSLFPISSTLIRYPNARRMLLVRLSEADPQRSNIHEVENWVAAEIQRSEIHSSRRLERDLRNFPVAEVKDASQNIEKLYVVHTVIKDDEQLLFSFWACVFDDICTADFDQTYSFDMCIAFDLDEVVLEVTAVENSKKRVFELKLPFGTLGEWLVKSRSSIFPSNMASDIKLIRHILSVCGNSRFDAFFNKLLTSGINTIYCRCLGVGDGSLVAFRL